LTGQEGAGINPAMLSAFQTVLGRFNLALLGLAILAATFWFTDQSTNRQPAAPPINWEAALAKRRAHPSNARVFVYIIDSLRDDVARNPAIMPQLTALCQEGVSVQTRPGFNSSSAASLRDAFTGRENAAVLATVATFIRTDAGVESIFHQMALAGRTSAAYSAGFFRQFGAGITREVVLGLMTPPEAQEAHVLAAVEAMRSGEFDCVFGHLGYTDAVAHKEGTGTAKYLAAFRRADALIPLIRARLPPGTTLVVMGDHGHDQEGRHGIGLNVPTLAVYVGPHFRRGVDLGSTPIMSHRYLLSQALELPMTTEAYAGELLPQALDLQQARLPDVLAGVHGAREPATWPMWIYLSLLATLWFNLACRGMSPLNFSPARTVALWAGLGPVLMNGPLQLAAMAGVSAGLLVLLARAVPARRLARWLLLPVLAGLSMQGWGRVLVAARPWLEQLPAVALAAYWLAALAAGAWLATRATRTRVMAVVFAVPALLFHPVYHHFGFPGTLAPLIACWFVFHVVSLAREGRLRDGPARGRVVLVGAGLFLLLQPMAVSVTAMGAFDHWRPLLPGWTVNTPGYFVPLTLLAYVLVFFPERPRWPTLVLGVIVIGLVAAAASRYWLPNFYWRRNLTILLLAGWVVARRFGRPEARICGLGALFFLYFNFVALTPRNFIETGAMIGALALCAQQVAWFPQRENLRADHLMLGLLGLMVTGWASMRWSGTHLEWHAVYDWVRASTLEENVGWFIPWIALKGLTPWVIVLWVLRDRLGPAEPLPAHALLAVFSAKIMLLIMLTGGLGGLDTYNRSYLETASVVGTMVMLYLGLLLLPRGWPGPAAPEAASR
jgi:hypothetical protein